MSNDKIRVAIVGVGNCASALVQGLEFYRNAPAGEPVPGLMHVNLGPYHVSEVEVVAAFDVDGKKVGRDVSGAIFSEPNNTIRFADVPPLGVDVLRGPTLDGLGQYYREMAAKHYAQAALDAGAAFVNCMPVFIASDREWARRFHEAGIPIVGDDIKSQVGATIVHRILAKLFEDRGVKL